MDTAACQLVIVTNHVKGVKKKKEKKASSVSCEHGIVFPAAPRSMFPSKTLFWIKLLLRQQMH